MKFLGAAALVLMFAIPPAVAQTLQSNDDVELESARAQLMKAYQGMATLSDPQWASELKDLSTQMETQGKTSHARILRKLSEPVMRDFVLDLLKTKIDEISQNGLILFSLRSFCKELDCFGRGIWIFLLVFVLTLDGGEAPNF